MRAITSLGHSKLGLLFYEFEVGEHDKGVNLPDRARAFVRAIESVRNPGEAEEQLLEIAGRYLRERPPSLLDKNEDDAALLRALKLDGYLFENGQLLPTTPEPAALGPQLSALEVTLQTRGFTIAGLHYAQAVDNFTRGNHEAANGQLRSFFEDLVMQLAERSTGQAFGDPSAALQHLEQRNKIEKGEWSLLRAFWGAIQDNGPHAGLSTEQEALFRLHMGTALARYLLHKVT